MDYKASLEELEQAIFSENPEAIRKAYENAMGAAQSEELKKELRSIIVKAETRRVLKAK